MLILKFYSFPTGSSSLPPIPAIIGVIIFYAGARAKEGLSTSFVTSSLIKAAAEMKRELMRERDSTRGAQETPGT